MGERSIGGLFKVSKAPFKNSKRIFNGAVYPYRMEVEVFLLPRNPILLSAELREKLTFIKNKHYWSAPFRRAMFSISDNDFQILLDAIKKEK